MLWYTSGVGRSTVWVLRFGRDDGTMVCESTGVATPPAGRATRGGRHMSTHLEQLPAQVAERRVAGRPVLSVVAPIFNEVETVPHFYQRVVEVMEALGEPFELVLVNDGSSDGSIQALRALHEHDRRVRVVDFSRNFGHQIAISAGLDHARGEAIIIIDSDLQDPPEVIPELVARWRAGAEVVYAQRRQRVADALIAMREHHRFMRGLSAWVGFRQEAVLYDRQERFAGQTKYPLQKMIRFALDAITGFSYVPLQLATSFGFALAGLSLVGILIAVILRVFTGAIVGQATTLILVLFLGGIQLIFLGIIGEYLGRIYDEVRARPLYIVRQVLENDDTAPKR